tara:strand:+ start:3303 stop:3467 length:165 start_codon:yes stop_codon:yes gene_type:complete
MPGKKKVKKKTAVGKKISKLKKEGKSMKQAIATALNMKKKGKLTKSGAYKRKKG